MAKHKDKVLSIYDPVARDDRVFEVSVEAVASLRDGEIS